MIVFNLLSNSQLYWTTRSNGAWSTPQAIDMALSSAPVALVALANGGALLAFEGTNGMVYWSQYNPNAAMLWSTPTLLSNLTTPSSPALAVGVGVGGAVAELAFASAGAAYHARFAAGGWSTPTMVGGTGVTWVALASSP
jgi:hypothetical protein